jgi:hypothetical protein
VSTHTQVIIRRIGETDQIFLEGNTPELALERADLRLQLVALSQLRQEQTYFLQEAIVLLEQGRVEFEEMPMQLYLKLSLHLAKAYMVYFELTQEKRYAIITQQILKPLTSHEDAEIYLYLAYAAASKQEPAMTRHWLQKYSKTSGFDLAQLQAHAAFKSYHQETWFFDLVKTRLH